MQIWSGCRRPAGSVEIAGQLQVRIGFVATLSFEEARDCVIRQVRSGALPPGIETVPLLKATGRVLAAPITADRDYPPLPRATRDGFAVASAGFTGEAHLVGEVRAGERFEGRVGPREAVEIMTGAPVPEGADAVIMLEHVSRHADRIEVSVPVSAGDHVVAQGAECRHGMILLTPGRRLGYAQVALLATVGAAEVRVYHRPSVAIVATGDELVDLPGSPRDCQVRNSNSYSLAAQVERAGGAAEILPVARDNPSSTRAAIAAGLERNLLLLSGGVSAGKYDIVEPVLREFDADFHFDRVLIQPGQPLVFGSARRRPESGRTFFFGLPGNPASTMVTFELFGRAAVELLAGEAAPSLPLLEAKLARDFQHKRGLTRFLPANLSPDGKYIAAEPWQGSGDVAALARSNAFLVASADKEFYTAGEMIRVLLR